MTTDGVDPAVVALLEQARTGAGPAVAAFYEHYADVVHRYVRRRVGSRELAEDLTGDVFERAIRGLPGFRWAGRDPRAWLLTIARNRVADHHRARGTHAEQLHAVPPEQPDPAGTAVDPAAEVERVEVAVALVAALERLSGDHREVLDLRFVQELGVAETAQVLQRSPEAVRSLQYRALRALAGEVEQVPALAELASVGLQGLVLALLALGTNERRSRDLRPSGRSRVTRRRVGRWHWRRRGEGGR